MRKSLKVPILILLITPYCFAQDANEDSLITILNFNWQRARLASKKTDNEAVRPVRMMTPENKNFQRNAREQQSKGAIDPNEYTVDGRSAALEKNVQEARAAKTEDSNGYLYLANVKNDSDRTTEVIFWEYRFVELANPSNVVRRQILCAAKLKPGEKMELSAFSLLGPSDVISAESLAKATGRLFDEKILVNRIEYADGAILQRRDWKYADVRKAVERAISTSWGKDICRAI